MIAVTFSALFGHWRRNPLQLFTLLAGLALATALWSGVQAINAEARASYDAAAATLGEGQFDRLVRRDGQPISQDTYIALRRSGWLVSPVIEGRVGDARLIGLDPLTAPGDLAPKTLQGAGGLQDFIAMGGQIIGAPDVTLEGAQTDAAIAPGTAIADIGTVQKLLGRPDEFDALIVGSVQPLGQMALEKIAPDLTRQVAQGGSDIARLTDSFHLNLTAFGLLSFAVGIFIVHGAIGLAFEQRRGTVRTLRALGVPLRLLVCLIGIELLGLALIAGAIGVGLGYVIAGFLLPDVAATLRGLYGADVSGTLQLRPIWWATGMAIALGGTGIASSAALWKLSRMPLLAGAQPRALGVIAGRGAKVQAVASAGLLFVAFVLVLTADGIVTGFALLGALLIGAALALPIVLRGVLGFAAKRANGVVANWFWADTRQQLPGLSLALMALLLAMAANVGVSTMVSSFRLTFVAFLDQRLASELYVTADTSEQATAVIDFVTPRVDVVLPIMSTQVMIANRPTDVFGARDHATYRDNWTFLTAGQSPWADVHARQAILINEQLARAADLAVGDVVIVGEQPLTIAGIYGDYGNPIGQAIIAEPLFQALFPEVLALRFGLRLPREDVGELVADLQSKIGLPTSNTINQAGIKAYSLAIFDRTFTVTTALNVLTLSVAGFAILMSLLTLTAMRVPQLAPAWAMGLTRAELGRLELIRTVMLAVLTGAIALPLGLALAWVLLAVVNVAAFGWRLPMYLFPWEYAQLGGFAILAAALAALWPAIRLARTPPADLLKVFSNER
ncbi:MAG: putative ABC transport system permease protein [Yoonia sp.]|jgi:putative ABC transport system permease protein